MVVDRACRGEKKFLKVCPMCIDPKRTQEHTPHEPSYGWGRGVLCAKPKESRNIINILITMIDNIKTEFRMTQDEVAELFGVSRNYIQQIEKRAIEKLRAELQKRGFKKQDLLGE